MMGAASDELRRLLDELRNLARDINEAEIRSHSVITMEQGQHSRWFRLYMNSDWLNAWHAELERILQTINDTLGNDGVERTKNEVAERTTTRNTTRTVYGNPRPVCEVCGFGIGDKRWSYCPKCGAWIMEVDE